MNVSSAPYHHPTPWDSQFPLMSLPDLLEQSTRETPQAPLLHFLGRTYSYRDVFTEAQRFAAGLAAMGVAKGDRVGLFLPNVP
ncbi:MAG: AMP-binding protein, partial [Pseudomonadota bacterium]